jgi:hypothetical protein
VIKGQKEIPAIEIEIGDLLWLADEWAKVTGWYLGAKGKVRIEVNDRWIERSRTQRVWVQRREPGRDEYGDIDLGVPEDPGAWMQPDARSPEQQAADATGFGLHLCGLPLMVLTRQSDGVRYDYLWCPNCEEEA